LSLGLSSITSCVIASLWSGNTDDRDGLISFDMIKHKKFLLVIRHHLIASMDPSVLSHWYQKHQLPTGDDSPVNKGLIGSVDKPGLSLCALT